MKRDKAITISLTQEEKELIKKRAKDHGLQVSDYIRLMAKKGIL